MDEQPLRLLIADDEPLAAERLQLLLAQCPDVDLVATASDGESAVRMYLVGVWQVARNNVPPFTTPLDWTSLPLFAIPAFAILVLLGWHRRRQAQWHKRLMLGAAMVVVLGPSFGRLPLIPPSKIGFAIQMAMTLLFFLPLFIWDRRTIGQTHPATKIAFGAYAVSMYRAIRDELPGVRVIGGCCGTDLRHVTAIAEACVVDEEACSG